MGKKNKKESNLDRPLFSIYECNNLVCMKRWTFDDDKEKSSDLRQCKACNSFLTISLCDSINNNKNDKKNEMQLLDDEMNNLKVEESEHIIGSPKKIQPLMSIVCTNIPLITGAKGSPVNTNGTKFLDDQNNVQCKKKFTIYQCTSEDCRKQWQSVHGWSIKRRNRTNGNYALDDDYANDDYDSEFGPLFTQRCRKMKNGIPCGNPGKILRIITQDVTKKEPSPFRRMDSGGRHDRQFCDMCAKLDKHQQGTCTNKVRVNINAFNSYSETVTYLRGPAPPPVHYVMF